MTGVELRNLLADAERTPGWLAGKLSRHRSSVLRWIRGDVPIPPELEVPIRALLPPAPRVEMTVR